MRMVTLIALAAIVFTAVPGRAEGDRDAAVYAAVFASLGAGAPSPPAIVVRDRTATIGEMIPRSPDPAADLRQRMPHASARALSDLAAKAKEPRTITKADLAQATSVKAEVVPEAEVAHAFEGLAMADAGRRLGEKHGGARSVVTLSPVAYDDAAHQALVYLRVECGGLCGGGSLLRLEEKDGKWAVVETQPLWAG